MKKETKIYLKTQYRYLRYLVLYKLITKLKIKKIVSTNSEIKLEIGAGTKAGSNGWTTLDINKVCDLYWDLRDGIPFPDSSVSYLYSSHLFEHLTYNQILNLLKESRRVLKKGGIFSICVPNAEPYIMSYAKKDKAFWNSIPSFYEPALCGNSHLDMVNYVAYMAGEHHYLFDQENLLSILESSGFENVKARKFDSEVDMIERDLESVYAICNK